MVSQSEIAAYCATGSWRRLLQISVAQVAAAELAAQSSLPMNPVMGGGTRLMLEFQHRMSYDIDLFITSPQWFGYLSPRLTDDYSGGLRRYRETNDALKLEYPEGEIDYITSMSLLGRPTVRLEGVPYALDAVEEVLAKKLFYRGWALTARDLFDWWTIKAQRPDVLRDAQLIKLLRSDYRLDDIEAALSALPASAKALKQWDEIATHEKPAFAEAIEWAASCCANWK